LGLVDLASALHYMIYIYIWPIWPKRVRGRGRGRGRRRGRGRGRGDDRVS
jgi:hypothetical protein